MKLKHVIAYISILGAFLFLTIRIEQVEVKLQQVDELETRLEDLIESVKTKNYLQNKTISNNFSTLHDKFETLTKETDFRIKMLNTQFKTSNTQFKIQLDSVNHESCDSKIEEVWQELNYIRKMVE